jgi:hypothetical protein
MSQPLRLLSLGNGGMGGGLTWEEVCIGGAGWIGCIEIIWGKVEW